MDVEVVLFEAIMQLEAEAHREGRPRDAQVLSEARDRMASALSAARMD